jgi:two-component system sensor histidine kinase/response regulator
MFSPNRYDSPPAILIVDDAIENYETIEALLDEFDYQLHYAPNGQKALDALELFNPDVILLDVMMPGIDGIEVCRQIRARPIWKAVPIAMVTALDSKTDLAHCLEAGANDFISKPIDKLELCARLRSLLRIKQQYDEVRDLICEREAMVRTIVHDLRNPLTSILLCVQTLQDPRFPQKDWPEMLGLISQAGHFLQSAIDDLLATTLLEAGQMRFKPELIDLCMPLTESIAGLEQLAAQKSQHLIAHFSSCPTSSFEVDIMAIRRAIDNLIANAIKFAPYDSEIYIELDLVDEDTAIIRVCDYGPGVPDTLRDKIFEPYEVGSLKSGVVQIGLGLAFCKLAIEAHGGSIRVRPNQPEGSIFEVVLPRKMARSS